MIPSERSCLSPNRGEGTGEQGSALIITVLLVAILVSATVHFAFQVHRDVSSLSNWENAQRASLLAKSGQTLSFQFFRDLQNLSYTARREIAVPVEEFQDRGDELLVRITDENAKLNLNSIIYPNGSTNEKALSSLRRLLAQLALNEDAALAIADWIDPDSEPRIAGSEIDYPNDYIWTARELEHIDGIDNEVLETLLPYVTVHGDSLVNINTAELPVLVSLSKEMTEGLAQQIISYRAVAPFQNTHEIVSVSGMETMGITILDRITVKSSHFRVRAEARVNGINRGIESVLDASMKVHFWREA